MPFINDNFLPGFNDAAKRLYHHHAASQPILDYHNHRPRTSPRTAGSTTSWQICSKATTIKWRYALLEWRR